MDMKFDVGDEVYIKCSIYKLHRECAPDGNITTQYELFPNCDSKNVFTASEKHFYKDRLILRINNVIETKREYISYDEEDDDNV